MCKKDFTEEIMDIIETYHQNLSWILTDLIVPTQESIETMILTPEAKISKYTFALGQIASRIDNTLCEMQKLYNSLQETDDDTINAVGFRVDDEEIDEDDEEEFEEPEEDMSKQFKRKSNKRRK